MQPPGGIQTQERVQLQNKTRLINNKLAVAKRTPTAPAHHISPANLSAYAVHGLVGADGIVSPRASRGARPKRPHPDARGSRRRSSRPRPCLGSSRGRGGCGGCLGCLCQFVPFGLIPD